MDTEVLLVITEIQSDIEAIEENSAFYEEINFNSRTDAIDLLEFHVIDRIEGLLQDTAFAESLHALKQRAEKTKYDLERIDINLFKRLQEEIAAGIYKKDSFLEMIGLYIDSSSVNIDQPDKIGYNNFDIFINGLLCGNATVAATTELEPEMVFYQKTPARIVFQMAAAAQFNQDDMFVDLGSGLGQVAILVNLISSIAARGIEYEPTYCAFAQACASQLNLNNVEFINDDARNADYSNGTVFFMYTPFEGSILQEVLAILKKESAQRAIRIFTYGPCSLQIAQQDWLYCKNGEGDDFYKLYEFIS